jgi:putative transposase
VDALRNVTSQLPDGHHAEVKARWWKTFDQAASPADARRGLEAIIADYRNAYRSATGVIERDLDQLVVHLRWPFEHRKRIRTTNLLERTFVEVRCRTTVIGRFPAETSALSLIWAVLELSSRGWRGVEMTPKAVAESERVRRQQTDTSTTKTEEAIAAEHPPPAELRPHPSTRKIGRHPYRRERRQAGARGLGFWNTEVFKRFEVVGWQYSIAVCT